MFERAMIGLHLGSVAALAVPAAASLAWGSGFELLKIRQGHGHWLFLGVWLLASALIAWPTRPLAAWRCGVAACAGAWLVAAALGLWRLSPMAWGMALSLLVLSLGGVAAAGAAGEHRVKRVARKPVTAASQAGSDDRPAPRARSPIGVHGVLWWSWALLFVQSFWCAFAGDGAGVRGSGYAGMVLVFFLMLPALCVWRWLPRAAAAGWGVAACLWAALTWHTPLASSGLAALVTAVLGIAMAHAPQGTLDTSDDEPIAA